MLAERLRIGLWLMIAGVCGFAIADAKLHTELVGPLWTIGAVQIASALVGLRLLRGRPTFELSVLTALTILGALSATGGMSDVLSKNLYGTPLNSMAITLIAAMLLPWGTGPQTILVAMMSSGALLVTWHVRGQLVDIVHVLCGAAVLYIGSIATAHGNQRMREQRLEADDELASAKARAEEEAEVASLLVQIGHALAARLGRPDPLAAVATFGQRALGSDTADVWMLDPARHVFRLASHVGLPDDLHTALSQLEFPPDSLPLLQVLQGGEMVDLPDFRDQRLVPPALPAHFDLTSGLFAPIGSRGSLQGVLLFGRRGARRPSTPRERRLAAGIAQATTIALQNAQLVTDLEAASRLKSDFVATISHELRTPLNIIMGFTEMLADPDVGPLNRSQQEALSRIERSGRELYDLVTSTLDVGRLEAGRIPIALEEVNLTALLATLALDVEPLVNPGVALRWAYENIPEALRIDGAKVRTILKNLIGNALKFTSAGEVAVLVAWHNDELQLSVADTGVGIPAEQLPVIFDMFRQGDPTATRQFGGVGLGLHIVHRLCTLLGGTVVVDTVVGVGSNFTVRLPALATAAPHVLAS